MAKKAKKQASAATAFEMAERPGKYINVNTRHEGRGKEAVH